MYSLRLRSNSQIISHAEVSAAVIDFRLWRCMKGLFWRKAFCSLPLMQFVCFHFVHCQDHCYKSSAAASNWLICVAYLCRRFNRKYHNVFMQGVSVKTTLTQVILNLIIFKFF